MELPPYVGPLDRKKMSNKDRLAYEAFNGLKARSKKSAQASSIRDVAEIFGVSQRLVQFVIRGKYQQSRKIGFTLMEAK